MTMHTYNPQPMSLPSVNFLHLMVSEIYSQDKILHVDTTAMSKVKSRSQHDVAHLHPPNQCPYQVSTSYTLQFPRYSPDKVIQVKVTTAMSKVKHLHPLINVPTKYPLPTPYGFQDIAQTRFYRSR